MKKIWIVILLTVFLVAFINKNIEASDGSASAEVIDDIIEITVVDNVNIGRFYIDNNANTSVFTLNPNNTIGSISNISHQGGQNRGRINIQTSAGAALVFNAEEDLTTGYTLTNTSNSNKTINFRPQYNLDPTSALLYNALVANADSNGLLTAYIGGIVFIPNNTTPGIYSGSFTVHVNHQ